MRFFVGVAVPHVADQLAGGREAGLAVLAAVGLSTYRTKCYDENRAFKQQGWPLDTTGLR